MPDVLPTINNEPAQGIQALLDTTYLWNPDVANDLIEQINALLEKLDEVTNSIPPYSELEAPVKQYQPCYNGDNVYVAAADIETLPATFNPAQWILIATKAPVLQAGAGIDINGNEISVEQQVLSDAAAGATAVQPEDLATVATSGSYNDLSNKPALGTAAYASTSDFATAAQGGKADTAVQPGDLGTAAYAATTDFATAAQGTLADTAVQPADLATVATSGSYTDLSNKPAIDGVTLTSQTTKADIGLAGVYKYKGSVATYADLANIQNPDVGDVYNVEDTGDNYAWSGTEWDQLGGVFVPPVTSVNSKTGAVVLSAEDVGATPQYSTMPTADSTNAGEIVQFTGVTGATYTSGFFYKNLQTSHPAATVSQTSGSGFTSLAIDLDYFVEHQHPTGDETIDLTVTGVDAPELVSTSTITGNLEFEVDPIAFNTFIEGLYNGTPFETATVNLTYDGSNWAVTSGNITLWTPGRASTEMEYSPIESLASVGITVTGGAETQGTEIQVELYGTFVYIEIGDLTDYGVTWKGTPEVDSVVTIDYTESSATYAWTRVDVQPAPVVPDPLPSQTGQSGKFLTTDGTDASWAEIGTQYNYTAELEFDPNDSDDAGRIIIKGQQNKCSTAYVRMSVEEYYDNSNEWSEAQKDSEYLCVLQPTAQSTIKAFSRVIALEAYQTIWLDCGANEENGSPIVVFDLHYDQSVWAQGRTKFIFEISCNDPLVITSTKDLSGSVEEVGVNVMCVPTPIYDPNSTDRRYLVDSGGYQDWEIIPQPELLPSQTGNSGKFLTTDGTDASWAAINALQNTATGTDSIATSTATAAGNQSTAFGESAEASTQNSTAYGYDATAKNNIGATAVGASSQAVGQWGSAFGFEAQARNTNCIQLGSGTNTTSGTFKVGFKNSGNYELLNNQGFIPEARLADTTNATQGQVLTLDNNNNAVWQTPSTAVTSTTATLTVAGWSSNTQTITVNGVTSSNVVIVSPQPLSAGDYASAGILCTAQNTNSLTFTCTQTPSNAIDLSIVIIG